MNLLQSPLPVVKTSIIHLLPKDITSSIADNPPTSIQVNYLSRHNPRQLKLTKENVPHNINNVTMKKKKKKKMIHKLSISFTHTTPIDYNDELLP
jgi:hypothetical protein